MMFLHELVLLQQLCCLRQLVARQYAVAIYIEDPEDRGGMFRERGTGSRGVSRKGSGPQTQTSPGGHVGGATNDPKFSELCLYKVCIFTVVL